MNQKRKSLLIVSGTGFLREYSGTQHLIRNLARTFDITVIVRCEKNDVAEYRQMPCECKTWTWWDCKWPWWKRRLVTGLLRLYIMFQVYRAERVLITECYFMRETIWAMALRRRKPLLVQFCQELFLPEETPGRWSQIYQRYAGVPDIVIDVDPSRARIRAEYFKLDNVRYVLRNTVPEKTLPDYAPEGTLWRLAEMEKHPDAPVLLYMGGLSREKPAYRIIDTVAYAKQPVFLLAFCAALPEKIEEMEKLAAAQLRPGSYKICTARSRAALLGSIYEADIALVDYSTAVENSSNQRYCAPTKLYESMACSLAVLGSNNESLRSVIEGCDAGFCADDDDREGLGRALDRILADPHHLARMKQNARRAFLEKFTYEKCCLPEISRLIEEIEQWDHRR